MRKKWKTTLITSAFTAMLAFVGGALFTVGNVNSVKAEETPSVKIISRNLSLKDNVYVKFAVQTENVTDANVKLLVWTSAQDDYTYGTQSYEIGYDEKNLYNGEPVFNYTQLSASQMTESIYVRAYVNESDTDYYSEPMKYSILEYAYNKLGKTNATPTTTERFIVLIEKMLEYGAAAEYYKNSNLQELPDYINDYTYVALPDGASFVDGDGFNYGFFKKNETVQIEGVLTNEMFNEAYFSVTDGVATLSVPEDKVVPVVCKHSLSKTEAQSATCTTGGNIEYYTCSVCGQYFTDESATVELTEEQLTVAAGHTLTYYAAQEPSGKTNGNVAHWYCVGCESYFADEEAQEGLTEEEVVIVAALNIPDFLVEVEEGKDPVVLQLSDPQLCYWGDLEKYCYGYIRETVEETQPDLILVTGDIVYGKFDEDGQLLLSYIEFMESLQIPWAPVFGNHDNECILGVDWQCEQFEAAEYCLFKQGDLTGNGNYSVGIEQGGELLRVFYMMDSNGCSSPMIDRNGEQTTPEEGTNIVKTSAGFGQDQIDWYTEEINAIHAVDADVKISFAYHIQQAIFQKAFEKYEEYDATLAEGSSSALANPLNLDTLETADETDFGYIGRTMKGAWDTSYTVWNGMKALGVDSIFVGHEHCNSASIVYEGVRFQYGQKSSKYDRFNWVLEDGTIQGDYLENMPSAAHELMGGTVIPLSAGDGSIGTGYIYYAGDPFYFEPTPEEMPVNGLQLTSDMLQTGVGMTIYGTAFDDTVNAYKVYSEGQGKIYFDVAQAAANTTFSFTVFIPEDSAGGGSNGIEFYLRIKDADGNNPLASDGKYVYYSSSTGATRGEWKTFTLDISVIDDTYTEFSIMLSAGTTMWLRDIAFTDATDTSEPEPEEIVVSGVELINPESGITLTAEAFDSNVNAYKATATSQGKVYIDRNLVANKSTVTFTVYVSEIVETNSTAFMLRIKPNELTENITGTSNGHIYYTPSVVTVGSWQTFTVDISHFGDTCTEFSFIIPVGQTVWLRDITIS